MEVKDVGLKIIIVNSVTIQGSSSVDYIKVSLDSKPSCAQGAILNCFEQRAVIIIVAWDLQNAIEKILYRSDALCKEKRLFFLSQIALALVAVENKRNGCSFKSSQTLKDLIREDRLYRIEKYLEREKEDKKEKI